MDINIEFARKTSLAYNRTCKSLCQELKLPQTAFDILMFLANNPEFNTARDICEIRGIRSGMASVAVDFLVKNGYLIRQADPDDRRIWRLLITEKSTEIILTGKQIQQEFGHQLTEGISEKDLKVYMEIAEKFKENILKIVQK